MEPGKWKFSGSGYSQNNNYSIVIEESHEFPGEEWLYHLYINGFDSEVNLLNSPDNTRIYFYQNEITATRDSLPGRLCDRAVNEMSVSSTETLTLPSSEYQDKSRDFYLKLTVTGSQTINFSPSSGITYTGIGNPDKTYSTGSYLLHFTETSTNVFNVTNQLAATGSYNNLTDKPSIPVVDSTLSTTGAAADAKAVGDALRSGFTEWEFEGIPNGVVVDHFGYSGNNVWDLQLNDGFAGIGAGARDALSVTFVDTLLMHEYSVTATRHLITPTKTSQLSNDTGFITEQEISAKRDIDNLKYADDDWFVTGAKSMRLVRDSSISEPNKQWTAVVDGITWVLLRTSAYWRFGYTENVEDDEESGSNAKTLDFEIDGKHFHL